MTTPMEVTLLGTGSPLPSPNRCGAGQVVVSGDDRVMIDCGYGAARRLLASGISIGAINHLFFTHLHSDHITDLPDLLMMRWTLGAASQSLIIYGPEGTREVVEGFRSALNPDVRYRVAHHGEKLSRDGIECIVHEVPATPDPALIATVGGIEIRSFEVDHFPVVPAFGFRVDAHGKSAVFSGDTRKCDSLVRAARGANLLVSEAVHVGMMQDRIDFARKANNERGAVILEEARDYHAPTMEVAAMARDAGVRQLVISHVIPPIPNDGPVVEAFQQGMSDIYSGPITIAVDNQRFVL